MSTNSDEKVHEYRSVRKSGRSLITTLPKEFALKLGIDETDYLEMSLSEDTIVIRKTKKEDKINLSDEDFLTLFNKSYDKNAEAIKRLKDL